MAIKLSLDVVDFDKEMRRVEQEVKNIANDSMEKRIEYSVDTLQRVTPVDTGRARKGWRSNIIKRRNKFLEGEIINDVEYINRLNRGHSRQAPKYFIEQVLTRIGVLTPE